MFYLTIDTVRKLKSVGFCFPQYENESNYDGTFYYNGHTYTIGGDWDEECSEEAKLVAREGQWLPDAEQLLQWLQRNEFDITVSWSDEEQYFHCTAVDTLTKDNFTSGGIDLVNCLGKVIYKICKAAKRELVPGEVPTLEIITEG